MKKFIPNFCEIKLADKSYIYLVRFSENSSVKLEHDFSSTSQTYTGVIISAYMETMRSLLRLFPNFLDEVSLQPNKELVSLGFVQVEPTELELFWTKK